MAVNVADIASSPKETKGTNEVYTILGRNGETVILSNEGRSSLTHGYKGRILSVTGVEGKECRGKREEARERKREGGAKEGGGEEGVGAEKGRENRKETMRTDGKL